MRRAQFRFSIVGVLSRNSSIPHTTRLVSLLSAPYFATEPPLRSTANDRFPDRWRSLAIQVIT